MSKEEQELLLTVARLLRAHLREDHVPLTGDQMQDIQELNHALRPFESNVTALHPNAAEKS